MTLYKKQKASGGPGSIALLGMLYIANVRLVNRASETIKHRILLVGCEADDIERKLRWLFDATTYKEMSITGVEKVREKVHFLSTVITQAPAPPAAVIDRDTRSEPVPEPSQHIERHDPLLFAVGVTTTMYALDPTHALRKVGRALIAHATEGQSHTGPTLSEHSTVQVEAIPKPSGYAMPRDVTHESNRAHLMRG